MEYTKDFVTSKDGTRIGYRQLGAGPGLILVHGGMMASQNLMKLGELLSDQFTVYIPDRRGRGLSLAHDKIGLLAESEDLLALADKTQAANIYGLSAGGVVAFQAGKLGKHIKRIALHEPPLLINETKTTWMKRYRESISKGNLGRAFMTIVNGTDDPSSFLNRLPGFIMAPLIGMALKRQAGKLLENEDDVTLEPLIRAMEYDITLIEESKGLLAHYGHTTIDFLLIKGTKSQPYLLKTIDKLNLMLPAATCVELSGQGHTVADNGGKPELVANVLKQFFR